MTSPRARKKEACTHPVYTPPLFLRGNPVGAVRPAAARRPIQASGHPHSASETAWMLAASLDWRTPRFPAGVRILRRPFAAGAPAVGGNPFSSPPRGLSGHHAIHTTTPSGGLRAGAPADADPSGQGSLAGFPGISCACRRHPGTVRWSHTGFLSFSGAGFPLWEGLFGVVVEALAALAGPAGRPGPSSAAAGRRGTWGRRSHGTARP